MTTAFDLAMEALEAAHADYVRAQRMHAANLMAFGVTATDIDQSLGMIDELEDSLRRFRESLRGYEATA